MPSAVVKTIAKRSGVDKRTVEKKYNKIKQGLLDDGKKESESDFYPVLVSALKKSLGLKEEFLFKDKFKKFL